MRMNLFFDLDGTLTDSRPGIMASMQHAMRVIGREAPSEAALLKFIGPPTHDAFRELLGTDELELNTRTIAVYRERYATIGLFENSVYPGISEGISALHTAGFPLYVVTSKPQVFAKQIIEHFGLAQYFQRVYGSELTGERSHKGELIAHVLKSEDIAPSSATMIGDRMHDIRGAKLNGVRSAGILWGYGTRAELTDAGADVIFEEMPELVAALTAVR